MSVSAVHGVGCVSRQLPARTLFMQIDGNSIQFMQRLGVLHLEAPRFRRRPNGGYIQPEFRFIGPRGAAVVGK